MLLPSVTCWSATNSSINDRPCCSILARSPATSAHCRTSTRMTTCSWSLEVHDEPARRGPNEHAPEREQHQCVTLRLPTIASQCVALAEQAERERQPYLSYLEALLAAELEDRERRSIDRRIKEARLPRVKTLDEFD